MIECLTPGCSTTITRKGKGTGRRCYCPPCMRENARARVLTRRDRERAARAALPPVPRQCIIPGCSATFPPRPIGKSGRQPIYCPPCRLELHRALQRRAARRQYAKRAHPARGRVIPTPTAPAPE